MKDCSLVFTYGTLQDPDIQLQLFDRKISGEIDTLFGYQLSNIKIMGKYSVIRETGDLKDHLQGVVYALSSKEILVADTYEGEAYKRILVTLASGKKAWVYAANSI